MKQTMKLSLAALLFALLLAPAAADAATCSGLSGMCVTGGTCSSVGKVDAPTGTYTDCFGSAKCCVAPSAGACPVSCITGSCPSGTTQTSGTCSSSAQKCCVSTASSVGTVKFENPLSFNTVQDVTGALLNALQGIIVLLSLVFIVIGAVLYITSGGSDKQITTAKAAITAAMIGLAIGIAAPSFLKEIAGILNWGGAVPAEVTNAKSLAVIIQNVLNFLLSIAGILAMIMLVFGGVMYLTSAGDEKKTDTAKNIVKWAIIGVIVTLASLVIVKQIAAFF